MHRHRLDPLSLVAGVAFASLGIVLMIGRTDVASLHLDKIWPIPVIVLGVLIILLAVRNGGRPEVEASVQQGSLGGAQPSAHHDQDLAADRTETIEERDEIEPLDP